MKRMTWQSCFVCAVLALSFVFGLSPIRVYPFSDFSMFAHLRTDSMVEGLVVKNAAGEKRSIKYELILPFTGLNIRQFSRSVLNYNACRQWIDYFGQKVKVDDPTATAIVVQDINILFDADKRGWREDLDSPAREIEFPL